MNTASELLLYTPFDSAESAWFWFVEAHNIAQSGAVLRKSSGSIQRPCEPIDIMNIVSRMFKQRELSENHIRVLTHYGEQQLRPDPLHPKQNNDYRLWKQAMNRLSAILSHKGIINA